MNSKFKIYLNSVEFSKKEKKPKEHLTIYLSSKSYFFEICPYSPYYNSSALIQATELLFNNNI